MPRTPHHPDDLFLAPVLLALDARLEELGILDEAEIAQRVAAEYDSPARTVELRAAGLLVTVGYLVDTHGWTLSWAPRGLRVTRGINSVVLGVPDVLRRYVGDGSNAGPNGLAQR